MTEAVRVFSRFPSYIQEYIYSRSWDSLRQVQIEAARCIFETGNHLLLTTSTASGETEAAFFPILAEFGEDMPRSIGVLYVAPLKSLINDQFSRMEDVLRESGVPVTHWHGDVAASHKKKLLEHPRGILQITPESLEAMLIGRSNDILRLFGDLRYIVIDEIHTLTGTDRGNQIICQLSRMGHLIGRTPRRIGLSATIGDPNLAADWLAGDTNIPVDVLKEISDYHHVAVMLSPQSMSVERFFDRSDPEKRFLLGVIDSCEDPEAVMENYRRGLARINSREHYDEYAHSGFFTVVREDNGLDTRQEVCDLLAKHFGLEA